MNDLLPICSGTNDIYRNYSSKALKNIIKFIKNVNYTNITIVNVPYRYDVKDYPYVNSMIKAFNSKLLKLTIRFNHVSTVTIVNNRLLSTKHGLHLNRSGKELLSNQLALYIISLLEADPINPKPLGCYDKNSRVVTENSLSCEINQERPSNGNSNRKRKTPVTR